MIEQRKGINELELAPKLMSMRMCCQTVTTVTTSGMCTLVRVKKGGEGFISHPCKLEITMLVLGGICVHAICDPKNM